MNRGFWDGPPKQGLSLVELQEYLKPRNSSRFFRETLAALLTERSKEPSQEAPVRILDAVGMTPQEFAEQALNRPELWDREQLDYLEGILAGDSGDERLDTLATDFFAPTYPRSKSEQKKYDSPVEGDELIYKDPSSGELPKPAISGLDSTAPLNVSNVPAWWKKL